MQRMCHTLISRQPKINICLRFGSVNLINTYLRLKIRVRLPVCEPEVFDTNI